MILGAYAVPHPPLIVPEIGRGTEQKIQKTIDAYREAMRRAAALQPDLVVLTTPHSPLYADYFHISSGRSASGDFGQFGASQVRIEVDYDYEYVAALEMACEARKIPAGTLGERSPELDHGTMVPMHFLQEFTKDFKLVRIGLSGLSHLIHYRFGKCIAATADELGRRVVMIASGDLSHKLKDDGPYGFTPAGPEFDKQVTDILGRGDFAALLQMDPDMCEDAAECGLRSFWIMAGVLDRKAVRSELLSYEGPFGVGYGVAAFEVTGDDASRDFDVQIEEAERARLAERRAGEDPYVKLARLSLETYVKTRRHAPLPDWLPAELTERQAGAFVSLKKNGTLRGCIGTIGPTCKNLAEEIAQNAISAALRDSRFEPVTEDELDQLVYSVDVLGEAEPIESPDELDVKRYGVIVECGMRRGLLLPDLAGVDTPEKQIDIARRKAGIGPDEPIKLSRFEVVRHK